MGPSSTTAPERRQRRRECATFPVAQPIILARIAVTTRRETLVAVGAGLGLLAVPRLAFAQRTEKIRRIGFLGTGTAAAWPSGLGLCAQSCVSWVMSRDR